MAQKHVLTTCLAVFLWIGSSESSVFAQDRAHTYRVKVQEISNSCSDPGVAPGNGMLTLTQKGGEIDIKMSALPSMRGKAGKGGKFKVAAARGKTRIQGLEAGFSGAGQASDQAVQLILIAEYYRDGKALCTQSWDVAGSRK